MPLTADERTERARTAGRASAAARQGFDYRSSRLADDLDAGRHTESGLDTLLYAALAVVRRGQASLGPVAVLRPETAVLLRDVAVSGLSVAGEVPSS